MDHLCPGNLAMVQTSATAPRPEGKPSFSPVATRNTTSSAAPTSLHIGPRQGTSRLSPINELSAQITLHPAGTVRSALLHALQLLHEEADILTASLEAPQIRPAR